MIVDRALIPDSMDGSGSLQMADYTQFAIGQCLSGFHILQGHCKVMCVSSPLYPMIIGNMRGARQMLPDPDWKAEDHRKPTTMTMITKVVICLVGCSKRSTTEENEGRLEEEASPAQEE